MTNLPALAGELLGIEPRAFPYSATTFAAFRISESGRTYTVETGGGLLSSIEAAGDAALLAQAFAHKDHLLIRETGENGVRLHLFAIKKRSAPRYVHKDHVTRAVHDLYAAPVCTMDGGVLFPTLTKREAGSPNKQPASNS